MSGEETKTKLTMEDYVERYKAAKSARRKYAIKQFFKIKRGTFGLAILCILVVISLMSPIIAPNPGRRVHADLSKPYILRFFDPNAFDDFRACDLSFTSSEDLRKIGSYEIRYREKPPIILQSMDIDKDGFFDEGSLKVVFKDLVNTSFEGEQLDFLLYFIHRWTYNKAPYRVYADLSRKFFLEPPTLFSKSTSLDPHGEYDEKFMVNYTSVSEFSAILNITVETENAIANVAIIDPQNEVKLNETVEYGTNIFYVNLKTNTEYRLLLLNKNEFKVRLKIDILPDLSTVYRGEVAIYANLYKSQYGRPYSPEELKAFLIENGIPLVQLVKEYGIISSIYEPASDFRYLLTWKNLAGRRTKEDPLTKRYLKDAFLSIFFRKGHDVLMTVKITISVNLEAIEYRILEFLNKSVKMGIKIDNVIWEFNDEYYGLMGTDKFGRDIFAQIADGVKISLLVGFIATCANLLIGVSFGLVAGYKGGRIDEIMMRFVDFMMSIPILPLLLVLSFIFLTIGMDPLIAIIFVLSILGWAGMARVIRSQVLALKANVYVEAAKASGAGSFYIIRKHILPGVWPLVLIYLMQGVVANILAEAGLSFLGVLKPTWYSLGRMIQEASGISATGGGGGGGIIQGWHWVFFPGFVLMLIGYAFYAISDAYDEIINPKRRRIF